MRSTQLRAFFAVAQAGGFSAAARAQHVSQPTLTSQVKALESTYGVELFQRAGRGVRLTETGKQLHALAARIAATESDALHLLKDEGALRSGLIRIGAVSPFTAVDVFAQFSRAYPGVRIEARFGNSESVLEDLHAFRIDVAVVAQLEADSALHGLRLRRSPLLILIPRGHALAESRALRIEKLHGERMVVREPGSTTRRALDAALAKARVVPQVAMELGSREAIIEAVAQGVGIGSVSEAAWRPDARIRAVRLSNASVWSETHVACLASRREARAVAAFLSAARVVARQGDRA